MKNKMRAAVAALSSGVLLAGGLTVAGVQIASAADTAADAVVDVDNDNVPDPKSPLNPQEGEDKCTGSPENAEVDAEGCTMAQRYAPNYLATEATAGIEVTSEVPFFDDVTTLHNENLPYNKLERNVGDPTHETVAATFVIAQGGAAGTDTAKVAANGAVTWTPAAAGKTVVPVNVSYPDGSADFNVSAPFNAVADEAPAPAPDTQSLTMSIKVLPQGKADKSGIVQVSSDGDDTSQADLMVDGADLSVVTVTLTDDAGMSYVSGDKSSWTGTKDYPATQNFGLHKFEYGTYQVAIAADVDHWALIKNTDAFESNPQKPIFWKSTLDVDGMVANKFVLLGYDMDNDGVADVEDKCSDTAAGAKVDEHGCSEAQLKPADENEDPNKDKEPMVLDADNDGIADVDDKCADTPAGAKVDEHGCSEAQLNTGDDGKNADDKKSTGDDKSGKSGKSGLANTGLDLMALSMIALTATAGGAGVVALRRRREI